jgi:site-specific recombinase XerD
VGPLEEYLAVYRPLLLKDNDPGTLFVTPRGKPMRSDQVGKVIGNWTTKFAPRRTTPHMIRDSVAYKWLKEHPKDFLTLSKILWHKNVQTTIQIYGARFNESSGTCAMEAWLDQRASLLN